MTDLIPAATDRDVYITRSFAAPRSLVWKFWTEPDRLAEWFGPFNIHTPVEKINVDLRESGSWELGMTDDATGEVFPLSARILKVIEGEYLEMHLSERRADRRSDPARAVPRSW